MELGDRQPQAPCFNPLDEWMGQMNQGSSGEILHTAVRERLPLVSLLFLHGFFFCNVLSMCHVISLPHPKPDPLLQNNSQFQVEKAQFKSKSDYPVGFYISKQEVRKKESWRKGTYTLALPPTSTFSIYFVNFSIYSAKNITIKLFTTYRNAYYENDSSNRKLRFSLRKYTVST